MATLTINGRQVSVDDGFLSLSREEQQDAVEHIANNLPADKAKDPSGFAAGLVHGAMEVPRGLASTAKRFAGIGDGGAQLEDPNYVPAQVTGENGSLSQLPQKVAESLPSVAATIPAAAAGAKLGGILGLRGRLIGGLIGATIGGTALTAGDRAKTAAVERTGNAAAEPEKADLIRGGSTALAENAVQSLLPTRLAPGMTKLSTVGTQGAIDAIKRYGVNAGIGGAGAVAGDAARQAGMSVGTEKGLSVDPSSFPESFVGGAATAGTLGVPKLAAENLRSYALREFGGGNTEATKNYASRLDTAGEGGLGNAKRDAVAHETVKADLKNELRNSVAGVKKSVELAPDVNNALQRAQNGDHLTPKDIALIESGTASAPDGANAAYLARTLRVAQLAQNQGSYSSNKWAGGVSGSLDKNVLPYLNPLRSMTGLAASGLGIHAFGAASPQIAAGVVGAYGLTRAIDSMTGMRSPAKSFAQHFADRSAQLRLPQTPQAPMATQAAPTAAPWGPRPLPTTSVPQFNPAAARAKAEAPQADANWKVMREQADSENAYKDLLWKLQRQQADSENAALDARNADATKQDVANVKAEVAQAISENKARDLMAAAALKQQAADFKVNQAQAVSENKARDALAMAALKQDNANYRANQLQAESENKAADAQYRTTRAQADSENKTFNADFRVNQEQAVSENKTRDKAAEAVERAKAMAARAELKAAKITKANGRLEGDTTAQPRNAYEPFPEERLYPQDITPEAYAAAEADAYLGPHVPRGRRENYMARAEATARVRGDIIATFKAKYPQYRHAFDGLLRQLHKIGGKPEKALDAIHHYAGFLPADIGAELKAAIR